MKLKNKKTGEIMDDAQYRNYSLLDGFGFRMYGKEWEYHSLAELNAEWEDYEEPKQYWFIATDGRVLECNEHANEDACWNGEKAIGNFFETKEEAELAVRKLKAWKRLKDKGFRFNGVTPMEYFIRFTYDKPRQILDNQQRPEVAQQFNKDLDLLFQR